MKINFDAFDTDNQKSSIVIDPTLFAISNPKALILLNNDTLRSEGTFHNYGFTTQGSEWSIIAGENKTYLFHERAFFPHSCFKEPRIEYWITSTNFSSPLEAAKEIHAQGCDVSKFWAQQGWYSEDVSYFIMTEDFNEALKFCGYQYQKELVHEEA